MAERKKITRRKPGSAPSTYYFTMDTQDAIVAFGRSDSKRERDELYLTRIFPAFRALVENLINVYKFQVSGESKEDLATECVEFLYGVITKFDPAKGSKAFAYFNVVAKHWLIIKSKQNAKNTQMFASLDDRDAFSARDIEQIESYHVLPAPDEAITQEEQTANLKAMLAELRRRAKTVHETTCLDGIDVIFANIDELDFVNKRAIMVYLRGITNLQAKQLSIVLSSLKQLYYDLKREQHD